MIQLFFQHCALCSSKLYCHTSSKLCFTQMKRRVKSLVGKSANMRDLQGLEKVRLNLVSSLPSSDLDYIHEHLLLSSYSSPTIESSPFHVQAVSVPRIHSPSIKQTSPQRLNLKRPPHLPKQAVSCKLEFRGSEFSMTTTSRGLDLTRSLQSSLQGTSYS